MISTLDTPPTTHAAAVHAALEMKETAAPLAVATRPPAKVANLHTVRRLLALVGKVMPGSTAHWSRKNIARAMGVAPAYVNAYLAQIDEHGAPAENPPPLTMALEQFEGTVENFLAQIAERKVGSTDRFETAIYHQFRRFAAVITAARQWGVFYGPGGDGKTEASRLLAARNPLVLHVTVTRWACGAEALQNAIYRELNKAGNHRGKESKMEWVVERLTNSEHSIVVDNCHQATHGALTMLGNLRDVTNVPLIMVGNERVLERLQKDEQLFRRVAQKEQSTWGETQKERLRNWSDAAERLLMRDAPDYVADLMPLAVEVLRNRGCMGSLQTHVALMNAALAKTGSTDAAAAFHQAHAKLIHDGYALPAA